MKKKIITLTIGLTALALGGCASTENTNTNVRNANSNTAVVVNSNQAPITSTSPTPRKDNANISKEDYEKNRAEYEKDKGNSKIGSGALDGWIWFKTKTALATTADLRDSTINVDVENDVITLRGTVGSAEQKTKAETVAKGIEGQKGVKNMLTVAKNDSMTNQMVNGKSSPTPAATTNKK